MKLKVRLKVSGSFQGFMRHERNRVLFVILFLFFNSGFGFASVSKSEAETIFDRLESLYQNEFKKRGLKIIFKVKNNDRINAEATRSSLNSKKRLVHINTGYLAQTCMTYDSVIATLCHELGHHLAKTPGFQSRPSEGEADYWAAQECLPKYYKNYPEDKVLTLGDEATDIDELCANNQDYDICRKTLAASFNKIYCTYKLDKRVRYDKAPSYKTPTEDQALWTVKYHPLPQCRLDTHLNGFMNLERPGCWYRVK